MKQLSLLPMVLALFAATAQAQLRSARLLVDAPKLLLAATEVKPNVTDGMGFGEHLTKTAAVGMASSIAGVLIGAGLGSLSNNLIAAVVPVLLANLFLPPILTVLVAMLIGNWDSPGRFSFWLPLAGAFVVNAAAYVIASLFMVVPWTNPVALLLYSLVDGMLMGGATVSLMHLTAKKQPVLLTSFVPGVTDTMMIPVMKVNL